MKKIEEKQEVKKVEPKPLPGKLSTPSVFTQKQEAKPLEKPIPKKLEVNSNNV